MQFHYIALEGAIGVGKLGKYLSDFFFMFLMLFSDNIFHRTITIYKRQK